MSNYHSPARTSDSVSPRNGLHVVIYSELLRSGGGRETWLAYFLPGIVASNLFNEVFVYALQPRDRGASLLPLLESLHVVPLLVDIGRPEEGKPISNVWRYATHVARSMNSRLRFGDCVLLIGSMAEGVSGILCRSICWRRRFLLATWLRSIHAGELETYRSRFYVQIARRIEKYLLRRSDIVIANGQDTHDYYLGQMPNLKSKIHVIPNAVDISRFNGLPIPSFDHRPLQVAFIGRPASAKGFPEYLKIVERLNSTDEWMESKFNFHVWGSLSAGNNPLHNMEYHGSFLPEQLPVILRSVDAVFFLNRSAAGKAAGISHGLLEIMSSRRLIVAWKNPAHCQLLHPDNSFLAPEGNIQAIAEIMLKILQTAPDDLRGKVERARQDVEDYSIENHIRLFADSIQPMRGIKLG
ncbi:MAG: glycosyltransferase [Pirellulales bacterium]|nr:glycosyltransferase [Pirellulales bacterium]